MPKIFLNLAFDHELSLGGVSNSYEENLFAPTRRILDIADSLNVPVTLFTDVLSSIRFREWDRENYVAPYEAQLIEACQRGHNVELHIHPHWNDVVFESGRFKASHRYSLHDFREVPSPNDISGIVSRSATYLKEVCRRANSAYSCVAYRAGGLNIVPSTDKIVDALKSNGILIDSSVAPGFRFASSVNNVDFSTVPKSPNWYFKDHSGLNGADFGVDASGLFEVPIVSVPRNPLNNIPALARRVVRSSLAPRFGGMPLYDVDATIGDKLKRLMPFSSWMLSFDLYWASGDYLVNILKRFLRHQSTPDSQDIFLSSLSHPKSMGEGGMRVFREFVESAQAEFENEIQFVSFPQIAAAIGPSR